MNTLLQVCWPTVALLTAFAVLLFSLRKGAGGTSQAQDGRTQPRQRHFIGATKFLLLVVILAILLIPGASRGEDRSFFSVAQDSFWGHLFEWPAAWCSAKIIALSISTLLILEAMLTLAMHARYQIACMTLLVLAIFPVALGCFGFYQLVKAVF